MFEKIKKALAQLVTGQDNETHDLGRWSWVVCTASVIGGAVGNWVHGLSIDVQSLGAGLAAVAGCPWTGALG